MANNLNRLRTARRLTQDDAAEMIGTTRNQYAKLEHGTRRLSLHWIERIARAYGIDPGEVVTDRVATGGLSVSNVSGFDGASALV